MTGSGPLGTSGQLSSSLEDAVAIIVVVTGARDAVAIQVVVGASGVVRVLGRDERDVEVVGGDRPVVRGG